MADVENSWRDLGEEAKDLIQDAISTGNYENLSHNISNIADRALKKIMDVPTTYRTTNDRKNTQTDLQSNHFSTQHRTWQRKPDEKWQTGPTYGQGSASPNGNMAPPAYNRLAARLPRRLYSNVTGTKVGSTIGTVLCFLIGVILLMVFGGIAAAGGTMVRIIMLILCTLPALAFVGGIASVRALLRTGRYDTYVRELGERTYIEVDRLARSTGRSTKFTRQDLRWMIRRRWFKQGHLDAQEATLITSHDMYQQYLQIQENQTQAAVEQAQQESSQREEEQKYSVSQLEIIRQGEAYIKEIHACNGAIEGAEISAKIDRMENSVRMIIARAKERPTLTDTLRRLMNYYLPTTVKLLHAYADLDKQQKSSSNIEKSKREIEDTIDVLNDAYDRLFDDMFVDTSLDISTDVEVMRTMLEREGLTGNERK